MTRSDATAAPRYRIAPRDGERLSEILASVPLRTTPTPTAGWIRWWCRKPWLWVLLVVILAPAVLAALYSVAPDESEALARRMLNAVGADPEAVFDGMSRLLQEATATSRRILEAVAETFDSVLQWLRSHGKADDQG